LARNRDRCFKKLQKTRRDQDKRRYEENVVSSLSNENLATVSLKVISRKRRRKCTLKSYDRFTNS
jgi:hypothetical protein